MRSRLGLLLSGLLLAVGCRQAHLEPPHPLSLSPSVGLVGEAVSVRIRGEDFHLKVESDLRRDPAAESVGEYQARLADQALQYVTWSHPEELTALVPATLSAGVHDLTLTDPWERESTLAAAFQVVEPPIFLTIEEAADGSGDEVFQVAVPIDTTTSVHAVLRDEAGAFLASPEVAWSTHATVATPSPTVGSTTSLYALRRGTTTVRANLAEPSLSADFELQVFGGCTTDRDCAHPCHGTSICDAGRCLLGPIDKDTDQDGIVDAACTGGTDCDDDPASCGADCFPGQTEADLCDGFDQDCDGQTDEDWSPETTTCGTGACAGATGSTDCSLGVESDSCDPMEGAAPLDDRCDGLDEDCDGQTDEDFPATPSTCGLGLCAGNTGLRFCDQGVPVDSCDPFAGAGVDVDCNGLDEDCDGVDFDPGCCIGACSACTGACCSETCTASPCAFACDRGCTCKQDCSSLAGDCVASCTELSTCSVACLNSGDCAITCEDASTCTMDASNSQRPSLTCLEGSTCELFCIDSTSCAARCAGSSSCTIDCTNNNSCNQIECVGGSSCLLDCTDSPSVRCGFALCEGGEQSCPGEIIVCNRGCP